MSAGVATPGPSFVREEELRLPASGRGPERVVRLGVTRPSTTDDGWWLAIAYVHDAGGELVKARDVAPPHGPPPVPPLAVIGPSFAGALSGLVAEENGRQAVRLRLPEGEPDAHPWDRLLMVQVAIRWEPMRAATMQPGELAREVLGALRHALQAAAGPGPLRTEGR